MDLARYLNTSDPLIIVTRADSFVFQTHNGFFPYGHGFGVSGASANSQALSHGQGGHNGHGGFGSTGAGASASSQSLNHVEQHKPHVPYVPHVPHVPIVHENNHESLNVHEQKPLIPHVPHVPTGHENQNVHGSTHKEVPHGKFFSGSSSVASAHSFNYIEQHKPHVPIVPHVPHVPTGHENNHESLNVHEQKPQVPHVPHVPTGHEHGQGHIEVPHEKWLSGSSANAAASSQAIFEGHQQHQPYEHGHTGH